MSGGTSSKSGVAILKLLFFLAVAALALGSVVHYKHARENAAAASANLRQIYSALELHEIDKGRLPRLAFFPDNPLVDPDSLLVVLKRYGVNETMCRCPGAPASLQNLGLNYVWNVGLNGKQILEPGTRTWMLVNIHALSLKVPPPHLGNYSILYTDGTVEFSPVPPQEIVRK